MFWKKKHYKQGDFVILEFEDRLHYGYVDCRTSGDVKDYFVNVLAWQRFHWMPETSIKMRIKSEEDIEKIKGKFGRTDYSQISYLKDRS